MSGGGNPTGLFVKSQEVVEELDLYVEYIMEPVHCLRIVSELATEDLALAVYDEVVAKAYNDKLKTTTKEILGPIPPPDAEAFAAPTAVVTGDDEQQNPVPLTRLPSVLIRFFDQPVAGDIATTLLETNVVLAIREVISRQMGWTLWTVEKDTWSDARHRELQRDLLFNVVRNQLKLGIEDHSGNRKEPVGTIGVPMLRSERTVIHFSKRMEVTRVIDITEQVIQKQEEQAFAAKQQQQRLQHAAQQRFFGSLCSANTPKERMLNCIQTWLEGIERQSVKSTFLDSARRTVLHWIVDWSEEAYPSNRLGVDLLRSHILFALELGISPLIMDDGCATPMTLATSTKVRRPRASAALEDAARRSRSVARLPLERIVFESLAGKFLQVQFSATKPTKFFTLEMAMVHDEQHHLAIFLYDLALEWKFPVVRFTQLVGILPSNDQIEQSVMRFYVVPFSRESHATTEGDIILCSNGMCVSVDYTARHPRVNTFVSTAFSFDVFGGEGDGFCCAVQWTGMAGALAAQEKCEEDAAREMERAALRVAKSSYLSSLAKELQDLEATDEARPKSDAELTNDDVFSDAFAQRILLFPYGPQPTSGDDGVAIVASRSSSSSMQDKAHPMRKASTLMFCDSDISFGRGSVDNTASVASPSSTTDPHAPLGVICCLRNGKLTAIPLSKFALTTHATAPLSVRVQKLVEAIDGSMQRGGDARRPSPALSVGASGLFTPMAQRGYDGKSVAEFQDELEQSQENELSVSANDNDTVLSRRASSAADILHLPVATCDLAVFCRDTKAPISIATTPQQILIGLPNMEVVQYTASTNKFLRLLDDPLPHRRTNTANGPLKPLGGDDYPSSLIAVDAVQELARRSHRGGADGSAGRSAEGEVRPTTIVWCGKSLCARTVRSWRDRGSGSHGSAAAAVFDVLVEDLLKDQEVTCAVVHPRKPHLILFTRRGEICCANLLEGSVSRLCPIALSEAEVSLRAKHRDREAGLASSGVEVIRFNSDGTLLMRYCPLYRSATVYHTWEIERILESERRSLVKSTNLICGIDALGQTNSFGTSAALSLSATASQGGDVTNLAAVPKERLRGYLERLTTNRFKSPLQARVNHAYFVVQALKSSPSYHANITDGDGRNGAAVLAALSTGELLKDTAVEYWNDLLDSGANLYQCSFSGSRAVDFATQTAMHMEAIHAYAARQRVEIDLRENALVPSARNGSPLPVWKTFNGAAWEASLFSSVVDSSEPNRTRVYFLAAGQLCLTYLPHRTPLAEEDEWAMTARSFTLVPCADSMFTVLPLQRSGRGSHLDLLLFPSGLLVLVEHPEALWGVATDAPPHPATSVTRPLTSTSQVVMLPKSGTTRGAWLDALDELDYRFTYTPELIASSWCRVIETEVNVDCDEDDDELDEEDVNPAMRLGMAREIVVAHVAVLVRAAPPSSSSDAGCGHHHVVADVPLRLTLTEWAQLRQLVRGGDPSIDRRRSVMELIASGFFRSGSSTKQATLSVAEAADIYCSGPFAVAALYHTSSPSATGSGSHPGLSVLVSDSVGSIQSSTTWVSAELRTPDGQRWKAGFQLPPGSTLEVRAQYDTLTKGIWIAICGTDMAVVEVDCQGLVLDNAGTVGHVRYFVESTHLPVGEAVHALWCSRAAVASILPSGHGNRRTRPSATQQLAERTDDEEYALLFLREGLLCALDVFVRKSITVVCSVPLHDTEVAQMIRDDDVPDPTIDPTLTPPLKVLAGGMNSLLSLTFGGWLLRHNALQQRMFGLKWAALCAETVKTANAVDEYGHLGGGIPSRTLVAFPSSVYRTSMSPSTATVHTRGGKSFASATPEEILTEYVAPLRYDHRIVGDLVASGRAPPRTLRTKGYLSSQDVGTEFAGLLRLLGLVVDAIESGCAVPAQRDRRGRTALHLVADLWSGLSAAERIGWFDKLLTLRCNVFAADADGKAIVDRTEIRTFLYERMSSERGWDVPYVSFFESRHASANDSITDSKIITGPVLRDIVQVSWSAVADGILYVIDGNRVVSRFVCQTGACDVLLSIPEVAASEEREEGEIPVLKVTSMLPSTAAAAFSGGDSSTSAIPRDHQLADILLFSNGVVATVYDPNGEAFLEIGTNKASSDKKSLTWKPSVARTYTREDPTAPSRVRQLRTGKLPPSLVDTSLSTGFAPVCPSDQHVGLEVAWFVPTGGDTPDPAALVCVAVLCPFYHSVEVVRMHPPRGVTRIFPRHLVPMVQGATRTLVSLFAPQGFGALVPENDKNMNFYESSKLIERDASVFTPVSEVLPCVFTQIVRAPISPLGDVFMIMVRRGASEEDGTMEIHCYSCPQFTPLGVTRLSSPFAQQAIQERTIAEARGGTSTFAEDVARQHLWLSLWRQVQGISVSLRDRSCAFCEGGSGMSVFACTATAAEDQRILSFKLLSAGDHIATRRSCASSEYLSTESCSPGYHHGDGVHISCMNGQLYTYHVGTGELQCPGSLGADEVLLGDSAVSVSRGTVLSHARRKTTIDFVAVHNTTRRTVTVFPYQVVRPRSAFRNSPGTGATDGELDLAVLHFTPAILCSPKQGDDSLAEVRGEATFGKTLDTSAPAAEQSGDTENAGILGALQEVVHDTEKDMVTLDERTVQEQYQDADVVATRSALRELLAEQLAADAERLAEHERRISELATLHAQQAREASGSFSKRAKSSAENAESLVTKEWTEAYWSTIDALQQDEATGCVRLCRSLSELRTLERVYVFMLWPTLRGRISPMNVVDAKGRTILFYCVVFYASYFSLMDCTPTLLVSRKASGISAHRWLRMKDEWSYLLRLGLSVFAADTNGFSLSDVLQLHPRVGEALIDIANRGMLASVKDLRGSLTTPTHSQELSDWRAANRTQHCHGTFALGRLVLDDQMDVSLVYHTARCCGRNMPFVTTRDDPRDVLWEGEGGLTFLQLPWTRSGGVLVTANSIIAVQLPQGLNQTLSTRQMSAVRPVVRSMSSRSAWETSKSVLQRYTVPLQWARARAAAESKGASVAVEVLSCSVDIAADAVYFQVAGVAVEEVSAATKGTVSRSAFLRMWQCPVTFLRAESLSSVAHYVADQLHDCATSDVFPGSSAVLAGDRQTAVGCVCAGSAVLYYVGGRVYAAALETNPSQSLLAFPTAWSGLAARMSLYAQGPVTDTTNDLCEGTSPTEAVLPQWMVRCSETTVAVEFSTYLLLCRVSASEPEATGYHKGNSATSSMLQPLSKIRKSSASLRLIACRYLPPAKERGENPVALRSPTQCGPAAQLMALYVMTSDEPTSTDGGTNTLPVVAVMFDVTSSTRCGVATICEYWDPANAVIDSAMLRTCFVQRNSADDDEHAYSGEPTYSVTAYSTTTGVCAHVPLGPPSHNNFSAL